MQSLESFERMWLVLLRQDIKYLRMCTRWLALRNKTVTKPIIASRGPIVSLTTHGKRIRTVYLAIESIANGYVLPSQIILWLDSADVFRNRPRSLHRLEERGLEIRLTQNYGPHKKYYPFLESTDTFERPLATADDDVLYPKGWLSGLVSSFNRECTVINCYRAHEIQITDRTIAPYLNWGPCRSQKPSFLNFAAGNSGCIYPPAFLRALKAAGKEFEQQCPTADDVWLHVNAIRAGFMIRQVRKHPLDFPILPDTQDIGLFLSNVDMGQNDVQIKKTYRPTDIDALVSCLAACDGRLALKHRNDVDCEPPVKNASSIVNLGAAYIKARWLHCGPGQK